MKREISEPQTKPMADRGDDRNIGAGRFASSRRSSYFRVCQMVEKKKPEGNSERPMNTFIERSEERKRTSGKS